MMFSRSVSALVGCFALCACFCVTSAQAQTVYSNDFDAAISPQIAAGTAVLTGVQGFAGLGPAGDVFGGQFLRSATANAVTLNLAGLPAHSSLDIDFLFAAIDSLDGTGTFPAGDFFRVTLDGTTIFRESFANATPDQIQSYVPPPGVQLARRVDLGFGGPGGFYTDSAYYLGTDPMFQNIAHSASSATITFQIEGEGNQSLDDESWAMDNLKVRVKGAVAVPEAGAGAFLVCGLAGLTGGLVAARRKRRGWYSPLGE